MTITICIALFLSTLSLRRATRFQAADISVKRISIHALLAESDPGERHASSQQEKFLSTLSLRRATTPMVTPPSYKYNFYPRSPCGERHQQTAYFFLSGISIHALLAESDLRNCAETSRTEVISIHALLAESDLFLIGFNLFRCNFYPRSPCGERRFPKPSHWQSLQ